MSCLYSSPEVKRTKMKLSLGTSGHGFTRTDSGADHASVDVVDRRAQQKRVPHPSAHAGEPVQLSPVFLRRSSSANQAFVRFAVTSSAAQTAIALNSTSVLEPFNRRGSRSREPLVPTRLCRGPAPVL